MLAKRIAQCICVIYESGIAFQFQGRKFTLMLVLR